MSEKSAAQSLIGLTLPSGWMVKRKWSQKTYDGGFFSTCYTVEKNGYEAFLKVYDLNKYFMYKEDANRSSFEIISEWANSFQYEQDVSYLCTNHKLDKVVVALDSGEYRVQGKFQYPDVYYLVFELATADASIFIEEFSNEPNGVLRKLASLHHIAVGIKQLHSIQVAHQDIKPENTLIFDKTSKLGDLGRSRCSLFDAKHMKNIICGERNYAPIELLYGHQLPGLYNQGRATDCYHLGSLLVSYFTSISLNSWILQSLEEEFKPQNWRGDYVSVLPFVETAFLRALVEIEQSINEIVVAKELIALVKRLSFPNPEYRCRFEGHSQFSMHNIISKLDIIHRKMKVNYGKLN